MNAALHCPDCAGTLHGLRCETCGVTFAQVDGIPCLSDPTTLRHEQGAMLEPGWPNVPAAQKENPVLTRESRLESVFALAHYPEGLDHAGLRTELSANPETLACLGRWLDRHAPPDAHALEVGCGPGRFLFELAQRFETTGFDLRIGLLRLAHELLTAGTAHRTWESEAGWEQSVCLEAPCRPANSIALVQGTLAATPFPTFRIVAAISLLDVLPDPAAGFTQLDRLVAPGGLLLIALPYQYDADVTPRERWWNADDLRAALGGYRLVEEAEQLLWAIPSHARLVHRYFLHAVLARKVA